jgi:hypothetical protein
MDRILSRLHMKLYKAGRIDHVLSCIDATDIRASRSAYEAEAVGKKAKFSTRAFPGA